MSNNFKKKDKKSIMNTVKKGFKSMRHVSSKSNKFKSTKIKSKRPLTPIAPKDSIDDTDVNYASSGAFITSSGYQPIAKSPSYSHHQHIAPHLSPVFGSPSDSLQANNLPSRRGNYTSVAGHGHGHPHNDPISHNLNATKSSTLKLKSSHKTKHKLPFNFPSLFINKKPVDLNVKHDTNNEFNYLLYDETGLNMTKIILTINIDLEKVYNEEYDNNYNRKVLGPIQPVRLPLLINVQPTHSLFIPDSDQDTHDFAFEFDSDEEQQRTDSTESSPLPTISITSASSLHYIHSPKKEKKKTPRGKIKRKHKKSASTSKLNTTAILTRQRTRTAELAEVERYYAVSRSHIDTEHKPHKRKQVAMGHAEQKKSSQVELGFKNKYDSISKITPDELEILARKLINNNQYNEVYNDANYIGFGGKHGRRNKSKNYIHPKNKIKRNQHNHLLQSNVERKSESVTFGLQLINSIKQITTNLQQLMMTFSDGLNDLLRICQQFIELVVAPLPRQVYNDYSDKILQYTDLVKMVDETSSNFYDSSQNLKDNIPSLQNVLQSNVSDRISQYQAYTKDMKAADNDIKSLQTHCDRTLRRLFREIPRPLIPSEGEIELLRKKSLKQHKGIRVFGEHYVASNSNEHICRAVPSKIRAGILSNYIHYVCIMDAANLNVKRGYDEILPKINVEFEESQVELKTHVNDSLKSLDINLRKHYNGDSKMHRYNRNKPQIAWDKIINVNRKSKARIPIKAYNFYKNPLMASPMHIHDVIAKVRDYANEEYEKKTYDEFEMVKVQKKNFKDQQLREHGKFNLLKNYGVKFDSANFINHEVIQNFFGNHYYHLGDILFEIPELYEAFEDYLKTKLSAENLYFLRQIDDIYFNLDHVTFNHNIAIQQAKNIFATFISDDSKQQINLAGVVRKKISKDLKKIYKFKDPLSIFDKAYDSISHLIHKESLPNFYKSQHFKNWYEKQRHKNEKERKMMKK